MHPPRRRAARNRTPRLPQPPRMVGIRSVAGLTVRMSDGVADQVATFDDHRRRAHWVGGRKGVCMAAVPAALGHRSHATARQRLTDRRVAADRRPPATRSARQPRDATAGRRSTEPHRARSWRRTPGAWAQSGHKCRGTGRHGSPRLGTARSSDRNDREPETPGQAHETPGQARGSLERTTGLEPATLTLAR